MLRLAETELAREIGMCFRASRQTWLPCASPAAKPPSPNSIRGPVCGVPADHSDDPPARLPQTLHTQTVEPGVKLQRKGRYYGELR